MAKTLLEMTNEVLRKVGFITGESGALTTLTDSARQVEIDIVKRNLNTAISEMYLLAKKPLPQEMASSTITLVTGTREYALPSDLEQIRYPLVNETTGDEIFEYAGGFDQMRQDQRIPGDYTGQPSCAAISPINGTLRFDYIPTADENGDQFTLYYDKALALDVAADTVPFTDTVANHLVNVIAEDWKRDRRQKYDVKFRNKQMSLAATYLARKPRLGCWGAKRA